MTPTATIFDHFMPFESARVEFLWMCISDRTAAAQKDLIMRARSQEVDLIDDQTAELLITGLMLEPE